MAKFISEVDGCSSSLATCRTVDDNSFLFDLAAGFGEEVIELGVI